jgi:hypothetical protein
MKNSKSGMGTSRSTSLNALSTVKRYRNRKLASSHSQ